MQYITPGVYLEKSGETKASRVGKFLDNRKRYPPAGVTIFGYVVRHTLAPDELFGPHFKERWDQDLGDAVPIFPGSPDPDNVLAEYEISKDDPNAIHEGMRWDQLTEEE